jgi:hypothetical protein
MRFAHVVCWAALLASCRWGDSSVQPRAPLTLVDVLFDSQRGEPDRIERISRFVIVADRALATPTEDSAWLLTGEASETLRSAVARGTLSATDRARRVPVDLTLDADDPARLVITPRVPLRPDTQLVLLAGAALHSADGVPLAASNVASRALVREFRVAPARECAPLARLVFPAYDAVPRGATEFVVAFDRPVQTRSATPLRIVRADDDVEVSASVRLDCPDADGAPRCLVASPNSTLEAEREYRLVLEGVVDDSDRVPALVRDRFTTASTTNEPRVLASDPIACANDETSLPPYCAHYDRGALVVRGETLVPAALRVRFGDLAAQSEVGISHLVRVERAWSQRVGTLAIAPVALDGVLWSESVFREVTPPPAVPALRIREVLARPRAGTAQEFVEVENVGDESVSTEGLRIATPTGSAELPTEMIAARSRALIVGASFDPRGGGRGDAPTAAGTLVLRLEGTLAGHGLADRGADVWIEANGQPVTRAPTGNESLAPRLGVSVVRADPRIAEDDPAGWSYDAADGSTPGAPDRLR